MLYNNTESKVSNIIAVTTVVHTHFSRGFCNFINDLVFA